MSVFLEAADLIEERGWAQGSFHDDAGRICVSTALRLLTANPDDFSAAANRLAAKVGRRPMHWNDRKEQTAGNVCRVLREIGAEGPGL